MVNSTYNASKVIDKGSRIRTKTNIDSPITAQTINNGLCFSALRIIPFETVISTYCRSYIDSSILYGINVIQSFKCSPMSTFCNLQQSK